MWRHNKPKIKNLSQVCSLSLLRVSWSVWCSMSFLFEYMCTRLPFISWSIAGVPSSQALLGSGYLITAPPSQSVCVPDVDGALAVWIQKQKQPKNRVYLLAAEKEVPHSKLSVFLGVLTPVAGSIFRPRSQTHVPKREFKNGHISRICFVFQVIQVISSGKFFSAEEVDLSFKSRTKKQPRFQSLLFEKETVKTVFYKCSNWDESTPQHSTAEK